MVEEKSEEGSAQAALRELKKRGPLPKKKPPKKQSRLLCSLQQNARARGEDLIEHIEETGPPDARRIRCQFTVGGHSFLPMNSCSRQQATEEAAQAALAVIIGEEEREKRTNPQTNTSSSPSNNTTEQK